MAQYKTRENGKWVTCRAENGSYNSVFNKESGLSLRWGKTMRDDPPRFLPELADIEITNICHHGCPWCYKDNGPEGVNMRYDTFVAIFDKLPGTVRQIAFGVDSGCVSNPRWLDMFRHCRSNGIIPNVTVADISEETAANLASVCGVVAVSLYDDMEVCLRSVRRLKDAGLNHIYVHMMLAEETALRGMNLLKHEVMQDVQAAVFLSFKPKGRGRSSGMHPVSREVFAELTEFALEKGLSIGFDSCSNAKFLDVVKADPRYEIFRQMSEPCEAGLYSMYVSAEGVFYPCSFMKGERGWEEGLDLKTLSFEEVWYHPRVLSWVEELLACRDRDGCPRFCL